jgi:hypothetical protein
LPSIIANEENQTLQITIDGNTYVLPLESSTYKGLQSIIWRPIYDLVDDNYAQYVAITGTDKEGKAIVLISGSAVLQFKVLPATFDVEKASYNFVDFHKLETRADAAVPTLTYVAGSAKLNNGILTLNAIPANAEEGATYGSTLEVTVNGDVASSDYFRVKNSTYSIDDLTLITEEAEKKDRKVVDDVKDQLTFVYTESLDLKEELALGIDDETKGKQLLTELGIPEDQIPALSYAFTAKKDNGLFQLSEDGVVTVKDVTQSSAINEYAYVTITYTKPTADGKGEKVTEDLTIQAVRADEKVEPTTIKLIPADKNSVAITYTGDAQVVTLDVRDFEEKIGGRDYINSNNDASNSAIYQLAYLDDKGNLVAIGDAPTADVSAGPEAANVAIGDNDIALYFKAGTTTSEDGLYLLIGKTFNKLPEATTLYAVSASDATKLASISNVNVSVDGVKVTRTFNAELKSEYSAKTIIGVLSTSGYTLESDEFGKMYENITPADAELGFSLSEEQSTAVAKLIKDGKLTFTNNKITLNPTVDLSSPLTVNVDLIDVKNDNKIYKTEAWTIKSPITSKGSVSGSFDVKDPTLVKDSKIAILGTNGVKPSWASVSITGVNGEKILTFSSNNFVSGSTDYNTVEKKGLQFESDDKDFTVNAATGELTWNEEPTGSVYTHTVTITVKFYHDWGTITLGTFTVNVTRG